MYWIHIGFPMNFHWFSSICIDFHSFLHDFEQSTFTKMLLTSWILHHFPQTRMLSSLEIDLASISGEKTTLGRLYTATASRIWQLPPLVHEIFSSKKTKLYRCSSHWGSPTWVHSCPAWVSSQADQVGHQGIKSSFGYDPNLVGPTWELHRSWGSSVTTTSICMFRDAKSSTNILSFRMVAIVRAVSNAALR